MFLVSTAVAGRISAGTGRITCGAEPPCSGSGVISAAVESPGLPAGNGSCAQAGTASAHAKIQAAIRNKRIERRSEERRVGKECRWRRMRDLEKDSQEADTARRDEKSKCREVR